MINLPQSPFWERIYCIIAGIAIAICFYWFAPSGCVRHETNTVHITSEPDTFRLPAIHDTVPKIVYQDRFVPQKVYIYQQRDTARREALQKDVIISGISEKAGVLEVQTISPQGQEVVEDYAIPEGQTEAITIDHTGDVSEKLDIKAKRKANRLATWRKWRDRVIFFALGFVGSRTIR